MKMFLSIAKSLAKIRSERPVVYNITNDVVMNFTANALLSIGASPIMSDAIEETEDLLRISKALVINLGTLNPPWVQAAELAMKLALRKGIPVVLDPVGAGASGYRTRTASKLCREYSPSVIRGNAAEIKALGGGLEKSCGVDSAEAPERALEDASKLSLKCSSVVCISGATDYVVQGEKISMRNLGHPIMSRVTGMGCVSTAVIGAFLSVEPDVFSAVESAVTLMGVAGMIASQELKGPGSFQVSFLDTLYKIGEKELEKFSSWV